MSDWVKIGLTLAGFAIITWSMVQQHEYRLKQIETAFDFHLKDHDAQNREIRDMLHRIDIQMARLVREDPRKLQDMPYADGAR